MYYVIQTSNGLKVTNNLYGDPTVYFSGTEEECKAEMNRLNDLVIEDDYYDYDYDVIH